MNETKADAIELLSEDLRRWGRDAIIRVAEMTRKYSVIFSGRIAGFSDAKKG